ncbi:hypothetical protein ABZ806_40365 [Spirillospora sp. NPDC047418]|jgi:hypothetical protein
MSTRILGLLTTTAAASLALTGGIAAATAYAAAPPPEPAVSDPVPDAAPPADPPADAAEPAASPSPSAKDDKDGKELTECADADCEVKVRDGQTIKLDEKYGLDPVHIKIEGSRVTFSIRGQRTNMVSTLDAGQSANASATYNGITFRPRMAKDGTMTLQVSHD